jgi:hypothetical protein
MIDERELPLRMRRRQGAARGGGAESGFDTERTRQREGGGADCHPSKQRGAVDS